MDSTTVAAHGDIELRPIEPGDADAVAQIIYEAFGAIHDRHQFARDFPTLEAAAGLAGAFIAHPSIWGVVAVSDGRIVGSNFLDERGPVTGVGPITVHTDAQGRGVGRRLMEAVLERGAGSEGVRLLQDSFNTQSLSLYASLGFEVREPMAVIGGEPRSTGNSGVEVRPLQEDDLGAAGELYRKVHGFDRTTELEDALAAPHLMPALATRDDRVVAYATSLTFFPAAYGVAETEEDMSALIAGGLALGEGPASFLLPLRQAEVFRRCLEMGLRVVKPMTYMTVGPYREPQGCWFPSVLY